MLDEHKQAFVCVDDAGKFWQVGVHDHQTGVVTGHTNGAKKKMLAPLGADLDFRHVALSPSGRFMAWLASRPNDAAKARSVVLIYETATGKHVKTVRDLLHAQRVDLPDEAETLVVHPVRPPLSGRIFTATASVVNVADGKVRWQYEHRFSPSRIPSISEPGNAYCVYLDRTAVRIRDGLLTADEVGITRWDFATGRQMERYDLPVWSLAASADRTRIAVRELGRIGVSDGNLASLTAPGAACEFVRVSFLPDGRLISWDDSPDRGGALHVWDVKKGKLLEAHKLHAREKKIYAFGSTLDASRRWMFTYTRDKGHATYDRVSNEKLCEIQGLRDYRSRLSGDGTRVLYSAAGPDRLIVRWFDARTGKELGSFEAPSDGDPKNEQFVGQCAEWFSQDGSIFGFISPDRLLVLVDTKESKVIRTFGLPDTKAWEKRWNRRWAFESAGNHRFVWSKPQYYPDQEGFSQFAATSYPIWDRQGRVVRRYTSPPVLQTGLQFALSPDGRTVAAVENRGKGILFLETATGRVRGRIPFAGSSGFTSSGFPDELKHAFSFSPDCRMLAVSDGYAVLLWDLARPLDGKPLPAPANVQEAEKLWALLSHSEPAESDRGLWALAAAPEHALAVLRERLKPTKDPNLARIEALASQLDSADFRTRAAASDELRRLPESALPALHKARKLAKSLEHTRRLDEVIAELQTRTDFPGAANVREFRALEVLERIGTEEARKQVAAIAAGSNSAVTYEARLILSRWR
jgi:WD40 repeat protein